MATPPSPTPSEERLSEQERIAPHWKPRVWKAVPATAAPAPEPEAPRPPCAYAGCTAPSFAGNDAIPASTLCAQHLVARTLATIRKETT